MDPFVLELGQLGRYQVNFEKISQLASSNALKPGILTAILAFVATYIVLRIFRGRILAAIKKMAKLTKTNMDDLMIEVVEKIPWSFYILLSVYTSLNFIQVGAFVKSVVGYAIIFVGVYYGIKLCYIVIDFSKDRIIKRRKEVYGEEDVSVINLLANIVKYLMWVIGLLLILANAGIDITALVAGMGVGGLAIALAAQTVLEDVFASFSIYFDKPYKIGDFIVIGSDLGVVERIGIKTTRLGTLQGEELVISNKEMTSTRVHNFGKMPHRRVSFAFGVTYDTPIETLEQIPKKVGEIVKRQNPVRFDRAHFKKFGDFSLDFEVAYYIDTPDYMKYMDIQQAINFDIMKAFKQMHVEFAFPTQTIHTVKDD